MNNFKVSVIVPVFNASEYISKTLISIINQDFDDFEIKDNGSFLKYKKQNINIIESINKKK